MTRLRFVRFRLAVMAAALAVLATACFGDTFSTDKGWRISEELVNSCAQQGIGTVERSLALAGPGGEEDDEDDDGDDWTLEVTANAAAVPGASNHVIAGKLLDHPALDDGLVGWAAYELSAYVPDFSTMQVGPEFSVQNTRPDPADPAIGLTSTGGVQYVATPFLDQIFSIWSTDPGAPQATPAWIAITAPNQVVLAPDQWYRFRLTLNYRTNRYHGLTVWDAGGSRILHIDLASYALLPEIKDPGATGGLGFAPGVVLTAESENLFPDCENQVGVNNTAVVYYDDVRFGDTETGRSTVD